MRPNSPPCTVGSKFVAPPISGTAWIWCFKFAACKSPLVRASRRGISRYGWQGRRGSPGLKDTSKVVVVPHRHDDVFITKAQEDALCTNNMVLGKFFYRERCVSVQMKKSRRRLIGAVVADSAWLEVSQLGKHVTDTAMSSMPAKDSAACCLFVAMGLCTGCAPLSTAPW